MPDGWEQADAEALGDPDRRADLVARYPGADALLAAAAEMGDRAVPAFVALDPSTAGTGCRTGLQRRRARRPAVGQWAPARPRGGVHRRRVQGRVPAEETARERVATPLGEAVRLEYALAPRDGLALTAVEYVIGAPAGTVLVSVLGPADVVASLEPDAFVAAMEAMP